MRTFTLSWIAGLVAAAALAACSAPAPPQERPGMAYIPAGEFRMGRDRSPADLHPREKREAPAHPVYLDAFYSDRHEVTSADSERFRPRHDRSPHFPRAVTTTIR